MSITLQIPKNIISSFGFVLFIQPFLKAVPINTFIVKVSTMHTITTTKGVARTVGFGFAIRRPRVQIPPGPLVFRFAPPLTVRSAISEVQNHLRVDVATLNNMRYFMNKIECYGVWLNESFDRV